MTIPLIAAVFLRVPPDWWYLPFAYQVQVVQPTNLVTFQWISLGVMSSVIVAMAAYIRSLHTEIRQGDKDHYAANLALTEKIVTAGLEMKEAVKDSTEAIELLADRLGRVQRARNDNASKKAS